MLNEHINKDGSIDWKSYKESQIKDGTRCLKCGDYIGFSTGYSRMCPDCVDFNRIKGEVSHSSLVRCPSCRIEMNVIDCELYELYEEGEHKVSCQICDCEFEVSTTVKFTFKSPETIIEVEDDDNDE